MLTRSLKPGMGRSIGKIRNGFIRSLQIHSHWTRFLYRFIGARPIYIGVALYKTGAYFNHDCYPSVGRYFVGSTIVLCATHPLKAGEMIGENYGPIFTKKSLLERSRSLMSRYWFKCDCKPCRENWQILDKLNNKARLKWVWKIVYKAVKLFCSISLGALHPRAMAFTIIRTIQEKHLNVWNVKRWFRCRSTLLFYWNVKNFAETEQNLWM